jgi:hypothetical protein
MANVKKIRQRVFKIIGYIGGEQAIFVLKSVFKTKMKKICPQLNAADNKQALNFVEPVLSENPA